MWRMCKITHPLILRSKPVPSTLSLFMSWHFKRSPAMVSRGMPKVKHQTQSILVGPTEIIPSIFFWLSNPSSGVRNQKKKNPAKEALIDANGLQRFLKELNLQPELLGRISEIIILLFIAVINNNKPKHPNGPHTSCISLAADLEHE